MNVGFVQTARFGAGAPTDLDVASNQRRAIPDDITLVAAWADDGDAVAGLVIECGEFRGCLEEI
jgi:hypothetical protein